MPVSPCSATRKLPARPSILNLAIAWVPVLPCAAGSSVRDPRSLRGEFLDQRRHAFKRARVEVERDGAAWRLRSGIDAPFGRQRDAAEIGDSQLVNIEAVGIDPHFYVGLLHLDSSHRSPTDLQRQGAFTRPIEFGLAHDRLGDRMNAVDIDLGRRQRGVQPRRPVVA